MQLGYRALTAGLFCMLCALATDPNDVGAQAGARVRLEENFRREPNGVILASLSPGTELQVLGQDGNWTEVVLDGWVWLRSLQASNDPAYELVVTEVEGENLRSIPSGRVLAHLEEGALLTEMERDPAWAHVTRTGWVWTASLELGDTPPDQLPGVDEIAVPDLPAARRPGGFASVGAM